MDYLSGLNPAQQAAVLQSEGPVMIIAGAGSGKTRVLTYRIAHLIEKEVKPFQILALTFTNKASREMRHRIESVIGPEAQKIWMGTFHSVFSKILRIEADKLNYPKEFTIYDGDDCKSLLRGIIKDLGLDDKVYKPNYVLSRISMAKNQLVSYRKYPHTEFQEKDELSKLPEICQIYKIYQEKCFRSGAMDFDDLLFNTNVLFQQFPDVLEKYQQKFKYIMVDEFQDTNISQYNITKKLADAHNNIAVVGDDAQSIYAFRGANIQNILNFEKDYPALNVYKLEENYRSTKTIVQVANSVIQRNSEQIQKNSFTSNDDGDQIDIYATSNDTQEARVVIEQIFETRQQHQYHYKDFAILYRTNVQSRKMEEALRKLSIPYKIFGGLSFYQRKEIKNLIAYLRVVINPNDEEALKRIINYPKRGIGDTTINKVVLHAYNNSLLLWDAIHQAHTFLPARTAQGIQKFTQLIEYFQQIGDQKDAYETTNHIAKLSGILTDLQADKSVEGIARQQNIQELLNGIKEFVDNPNHIEDVSLPAFLQEISLLTSFDNDTEEEDYVSLMTIHSSKGLEFKNVYLVGMEEEIFPSVIVGSTKADLEEERRLFYVAITRAEHRLTLSYAMRRYKYGEEIECNPSRFLREIPSTFLAHRSIIQTQQKPMVSTSINYKNLLDNIKPSNKPVKQHQVSENFEPSDTSNLNEGMKVEHAKFGFGKVINIQGEAADRKAVINFENEGKKTLVLSFAKLHIHS